MRLRNPIIFATITIGLILTAAYIGGTRAHANTQPPEMEGAPVVTIHDNRWHCLPTTVTVEWTGDYTSVETESGMTVQNGIQFAVYNGRVDLVTSGWFYIPNMYVNGWEPTGWDYAPVNTSASSGRYNAPAPINTCNNPPRRLKNGVRR